MGLDFEIATIDALNGVVDLLNRVTYDLVQKNINQWKYPWDNKVIEDDILNKRLIAVKNGHEIIAVFSIKELSSFFDINLGDDGALYIYRIAVDINFRGRGIGNLIIDYCREYGKEERKETYLDCWQGNYKLRKFYEKQGLNYIEDYKEEDYFVSAYKL